VEAHVLHNAGPEQLKAPVPIKHQVNITFPYSTYKTLWQLQGNVLAFRVPSRGCCGDQCSPGGLAGRGLQVGCHVQEVAAEEHSPLQ
jgi:hypothetical protein